MIKIEKNNIVVREFEPVDFREFQAQLCNNPGWNKAFTLWNVRGEQAHQLFLLHLMGYDKVDLKENRLMYGIFTKSGLLIGECGFEYNPNYNAVEIFVGLVENARGKHYSKEVLEALIEISKVIGLKQVNANIPDAHTVGVKMLENSQFVFVKDYMVEFQGVDIKMKHYAYKN